MVSSHAGAAAVEGQAAGAAQQLRCLAVSPDTCHVAVGDQLGNVKAYDLATSQLVAAQEAHNGEVLTLDYALLADGRCLLASGSRDALIHLYDATGGYQLLETMDDHAAPVTGVKLANEGTCLISCSSDGTIKFRLVPLVLVVTCIPSRKLHCCLDHRFACLVWCADVVLLFLLGSTCGQLVQQGWHKRVADQGYK